jgi:hypothetical protein
MILLDKAFARLPISLTIFARGAFGLKILHISNLVPGFLEEWGQFPYHDSLPVISSFFFICLYLHCELF